MLFRRAEPEKLLSEMGEEELDNVIAQCDAVTNKIQAKRKKERSRTTIGFATGLKALAMIAGAIALTSVSGSVLFGLIAAVGVAGGFIYRSIQKEYADEDVAEKKRMVANRAVGYFKGLRESPAFRAQVANSIADDFKAGATGKVTVSKPLTLRKRQPALSHKFMA